MFCLAAIILINFSTVRKILILSKQLDVVWEVHVEKGLAVVQ